MSWKRVAGYAVILSAGFGSAAALTEPKSELGQIEGNVTDVVGAYIAGATIVVLDKAHEQSIGTVSQTDAKGNFVVSLPAGGYDILVSYPTFQAQVQTVAIRRGRSLKLKWKLKTMGCDFPTVNCDTVQ